MKIIKATLNDIDLLSEMNIQLREDEKIDNVMSHNEVHNRMKEFLESDEYLVFILTDNTNNIGYALIKTSVKPMYLRQLFIKREYRNKGFGSFFLNSLLKLLDIDELDLEAMVWNEPAIRFYEKFGFKKRYTGMRYKK